MLFCPTPMTGFGIADADDLVVRSRDIAADLPLEARARDRGERRLQLDAMVVHLPDVDELQLRESRRRRNGMRHDLVHRVLVIVGEVEIEPLEQLRLESELDFFSSLRLEIGIAERSSGDRVRSQRPLNREIRSECREDIRRTPRLSVRATHVQCVDEARVPEWLLVHHPRCTDLRVRDPLEVLAERAVVVDAQCTGEKETVVPRELFLPVRAHGGVQNAILVRLQRRRRRGDRFDTRGWKSHSAEKAGIDLRTIELATDRACRLYRRGHVERCSRRVVGGEEGVVAKYLSDRACRRRWREKHRVLRRCETLQRLAIVAGVIDPGDEALTEPAQRPMIERDAAGEPVRLVGVVVEIRDQVRRLVRKEAASRGEGIDVAELGSQHRRHAAVGAEMVVELHEVEARRDIQLGRRIDGDVRVPAELARRVVRLHAAVETVRR